MKNSDFTVSILVAATPEHVFEQVNNVRGWWSANIDGRTDHSGAVFDFHHQDMHFSTHRITELVPGRKVVWRTEKAKINFVKDKQEWDGTDVLFEITPKGGKTELRFTHKGLVPALECYDDCSAAWGFYIRDSLRKLIETGTGEPEISDGTVASGKAA